jgi:hypothetical protein
MTVKINADTSDGLKFVSDTSGAIDLQANGSTKIHMASDGDLGVGTSSPDSKLHVHGSFRQTGATAPFEWTVNAGGLDTYKLNAVGYADNIIIANSGGKVLMRQATSPANATLTIKTVTGSEIGIIAQSSSNTGTSDTFANYNASGSYVGGINCTSSATAFPTSSDYRLKENVTYSFDATTRLKQLKPCRFNFKIDTDNTVDGFLAHEVSSIVPEAIFGQKDAMETYTDDDGDEQTRIKAQSIDQSKLVPLLVKTIQELEARITALES